MSKDIYKIEVPIMTNNEIKQFERLMETEFESFFDEVTKHIYKDKECIYLQKMVEKLKNDLDKEKEKNKYLENEKERIGKLYYEVNENCIIYEKNYISKDKIREILQKLENRKTIEYAKMLIKELLEE